MPKLKTHSGYKKRIKVTGTGKLLRRHAKISHLLSKHRRVRAFPKKQEIQVSACNRHKIKQLIHV